jgi:hypothetical protein
MLPIKDEYETVQSLGRFWGSGLGIYDPVKLGVSGDPKEKDP